MLGQFENRPDPFVVPPLGGMELSKGGFPLGNDDDKPPKGGTANWTKAREMAPICQFINRDQVG